MSAGVGCSSLIPCRLLASSSVTTDPLAWLVDLEGVPSAYAASFLEEFVDEVPWVHLDIAGTAWDTGREYVGSGATGFGTRLLIQLAGDLSA